MASPSANKVCFHCDDSSSDSLRNGWDLRSGKFAQLCHRCHSIYESGRFCERFHKKQNYWKKCQFCSMPVHYSCLVSFGEWFSLEGGESKLICMKCTKITSFMERNFSNVMDRLEGIKKFQICRAEHCAVAPLFEIVITAFDIDNENGRVVIPDKHAVAYFPEVTDPHGIPLCVIDEVSLKEWNLHFCFWLNKIYMIDELNEYMVSNKLQEGDTLTFSRLIPVGPYLIGFSRTSTKKPARKASTRRGK